MTQDQINSAFAALASKAESNDTKLLIEALKINALLAKEMLRALEIQALG